MARNVVRGPARTAPNFAPTAWRTRDVPEMGETFALALPSGQDALIRRTTMADLVERHVFMAPIAGPLSESQTQRVLAAVVVRPELTLPPSTPLRDRKKLYVDDVPAADQMAILTRCGVFDAE